MTPMRRFKLSLLAFALLAVLGMLTASGAEASEVAFQLCLLDCENNTWGLMEICENHPFPPEGGCSVFGTDYYDMCAAMCAIECF